MDFEYKGGNCVVITAKQLTVVVDGKLSPLGLKDIQIKDAVELATESRFATNTGRVTIDMPGEYEVGNVSVVGVPATRMIDADGSMKTTMYRLVFPELTVAVLGHVAAALNDEQLESLGLVDVLILPVGGGGYTLDSYNAVGMVHKINPKVVIPTHYADPHATYEVPQEALAVFTKELGAQQETTPKWKVKGGVLPEAQTLVELTRTA